MTRPGVTVVLPFRNAAATLPRALDSLRAQSYGVWECVAIDDGSTDGSRAWMEEAARSEPRLRVVGAPGRGIVAALNHGLALANAPLVARFDADDRCHPERLARQVAFLEAHTTLGLVGSRVAFESPDPASSAGYAAHVAWLNSVVTEDQVRLARFVESPFAHPSVMFRRHLVRDHGGYREGDFPEDYELWLRWLDAGVRMAKVPDELLHWSDPPDRLSRTDPRYRPEAFFRLKAGFLARWWFREPARREPAPALWIWGAGRLTRRRVEALTAHGVSIDRFLDIDPHKQGIHRDGRRVVDPQSLPPPGSVFVVGYVGSRGARDLQRAFLHHRGYVEGRDFLFAA